MYGTATFSRASLKIDEGSNHNLCLLIDLIADLLIYLLKLTQALLYEHSFNVCLYRTSGNNIFIYSPPHTAIMDNKPMHLVEQITESASNVTTNVRETTENINETADNLSKIANTKIFRRFDIHGCTLLLGIAMGFGLKLLNESIKEPYEKIENIVESNIENRYFLMLLEDNFGLYKAESIIKALNQKNNNQELDDDSPEFKTLHHFEETVLNKNNYFYQKQETTNKISDIQLENKIDSKPVETYREDPEMVAIEFADNDVFANNTAAACYPGRFFDKQVELSNASNAENNALVKIDNPIDCKTIKKSKCVESLEKDNTLVQVPFSVAEKLYPESINTTTNYNVLPSCSYALAEIVDE